jgi:hypothetical protein
MSTFPVEIRLFLSGYIKNQKLQTENMQAQKNVSLQQQDSQASKEKRPNYGSVLAFGQGKDDELSQSRLYMWRIFHKRRHIRCRRLPGNEEGLRGQAQAAGRFEQDGWIAGREAAGIGQ